MGIAAFAAGWLLFLFFMRGTETHLGDLENVSKNPGGKLLSFSHESIGTGALALSSKQQLGWVADVAREVVILGYNNRPDAQGPGVALLMGLKGGMQPVEISQGKTIFLENREGGLHFTEKEGSVWVQPLVLGQEGVLVEVGRTTVALGKEVSQFVMPFPGSLKKKNKAEERYFQAFEGALFWEKDKLLEMYGGSQFEEKKSKYRVSFPSGSGGYACSVGVGDELIWKEGEWKEKEQEITSFYPLAKVMAVSPQGVKIHVWDVSGFEEKIVELPLQVVRNFDKSSSFLPKEVRLRTANQVSGLFGKKRISLKKGDWLLKTQTGFKNVRSMRDIKMCLSHRLKGELFVVDTIEKEGGGWVLKGNLFDPMRTQVIPITCPIESEKKKLVRKQKAGAKRR